LRRTRSTKDKRVRCIVLTPKGKKVLEAIHDPASRAGNRAIAALSSAEQEQFLDFLVRLVRSGNEYGRAPLRLD
jgi:DNA-binding MarR family transcriptional regulator